MALFSSRKVRGKRQIQFYERSARTSRRSALGVRNLSRLKIERQYFFKQIKLKQTLMQDLLTGQKEVTPDPEDFDRE